MGRKPTSESQWAQVDRDPPQAGAVLDAAEQADRLVAALGHVPAPGVGLLLGDDRPQLLGRAPDAVELVVAGEVDADQVDNQRVVVVGGREVDAVEVVGGEAPAVLLVPAADGGQLVGEWREHAPWRLRADGGSGRQLGQLGRRGLDGWSRAGQESCLLEVSGPGPVSTRSDPRGTPSTVNSTSAPGLS